MTDLLAKGRKGARTPREGHQHPKTRKAIYALAASVLEAHERLDIIFRVTGIIMRHMDQYVCLVTPREAGEAFRVSAATVTRWVGLGMPAVTIPGRGRGTRIKTRVDLLRAYAWMQETEEGRRAARRKGRR